MSTITIDTNSLSEVGENIKAVVTDGQLVLVINTKENIGPSSSGKMIGVGSTGGFAVLPGGLKGNIYVGKKA